MSVHLNDLSKVYLNNILESSCEDDEPKMKKSKKKNNEMEDDEIEEALDPVGQEDSDPDNDGNPNDPNDKYIMKRRKAIGKAIAKRDVKEGFSNWRNDLIEVIEPERLPSKMKEGNVDNYNGKNKCVTINPEVKEQVQILESFELSEEYITETVNGAVDYFMEEGINEDGLEIIINELGIEEFVSFVFEIGNEVLTEARTLLGKKKNPQKLPKGTAPTQATKAAVAKYGTTRKFKSPSPTGTIKKNRPGEKAVEKAKETQTSKKPVRDAIARGVFGVVKAYQAGMERHRKAMNLAKETGKTVAKAAKVGAKGASEFGKGVKSGATATVDAAKKAKKVISAGYEVNGEILDEKATSEQQQKLFGLALSVKRGETPRSEASAEVLKIVDSMSEKKIRDFAKTKHEGIPKKVEEELDPTTPQQIAAHQKLTKAEKELSNANTQALRKIKKTTKSKTGQEPENVNAGYEPDGKMIGEEESDTMKDRHLERGGMGARSSTSPAKPSKSTKPYDPEERKKVISKAIELVRNQTTAKYGNKSLM